MLILLGVNAAVGNCLRIASEEITIHREAGIDYVPLSRLAQVLGGKFWRVRDRFVAVLPGDSVKPEQEYVFWVDSALVRCADREMSLPLTPVQDRGQIYIPVLELAGIFPELASTVPVLRLKDVCGNKDTVVVRFEAAGQESISWHGDTRSSLDYRLIVGARCDSIVSEQLALVPILATNGLVQTATLHRNAATVIHFTFRQPSVAEAFTDSAGAAVRIWPRPVRRIRRVVIDPGHGGKDPGAVGRLETQEKKIVLDVARRVKKRLETSGFEVLMTRDRDAYVSLSSRSKFANDKKADLFISIHANAAPNRRACGLETYFLSEAKTDWERAVAARENASLEFEMKDSSRMPDELELILADLAQNEFLDESSKLAACIQKRTVPYARVKDRGVRQANFFVLRNDYMPAVLVECGFLSNRSEEKLLRNSRHRERLAEGICRGIIEFAKDYEQRINRT